MARARPTSDRRMRSSVLGGADLQAAETVTRQVSGRLGTISAGRAASHHRIVAQPALKFGIDRLFLSALGRSSLQADGKRSVQLRNKACDEGGQ